MTSLKEQILNGLTVSIIRSYYESESDCSLGKMNSSGYCKCICPFPSHRPPDKDPSFSINLFNGGGFKCFGCGKSGDIFKFHMEKMGCSFKEALQFFADRLGINPQKNKGPITTDFTVYWDNLIKTCEDTEPIYRYLSSRGIGHNTIDREIKHKNITCASFNGKKVLAARFCEVDGSKKTPVIQFISTDGTALNDDGATKIFKKGSKATKGFFQCGSSIETAKEIIIVEAPIDALSIVDERLGSCCLALGGSNLIEKVKDLRKYRDQGIKIISFMDKDPSGFKSTQGISMILGQKALNIRWDSSMPNKSDPNDLVKAGKRHLINEMIEGATYDPEYGLIGELKKTREKILKCINETDNTDKLLGPIARDVTASGLPRTYVLMLRKMIAKKAGVTVAALQEDAGERRVNSKSCDSSKINHLEIAEQVIDTIGPDNIIYSIGYIWMWKNTGVWEKADDQEIKLKIHSIIGCNENINQNVINSILAMVQTKSFKANHRFDLLTDTINCANGQLAWTKKDGWTLIPHNKEHFRTTQIPINYDPEAQAPRFGKFLSEIFTKDKDKILKAALICEVLGYTMLSSCLYEIFILLIGPGANGKSVLMRIVEALVGLSNVAAVQPCQLDNKFQRAHFHGKLANVVTEIREGHKIEDAQIKALASGELTTAEHKHKAPFDFYPFATCWFGTNHMPHTRDFSEALFRRAIIVPFNRVFTEKEQDRHLIDKLKKELPGILNMALDGLEQVFLSGGFTRTAECEQAKKRWRIECNQAAQFAEDCCEFGSDFYEKSADFYKSYTQWAEENGIKKTLNRNNLTSRMCRIGAVQNRGTGGVRILSGVRLKGF
jgi:P4 family phage/plasmid primase-like protien